RAKGQLTENIEDIRAELPSLLVERIEIPGMPEETPDLAAVQSLIPAAAAVSLDSDAQRGQGVTAAAQSSRQDTVQARKSLNEMGLMYHSQSQFEAAIKRNDELAVDLFLSAG